MWIEQTEADFRDLERAREATDEVDDDDREPSWPDEDLDADEVAS